MATTQTPSGLAAFSLSTAQVTTGTPETVVNDSVAQAQVGSLIRYNGNIYRYVQFNSGTNTIAASTNAVCYWKTLSPNPAAGTSAQYVVTCDSSSAIGGGAGNSGVMNQVAGIIKGIVTTLFFTWIQVGGVTTAQTTSGVIVGSLVIGQTGSNYQFNHLAPGTSVYVGAEAWGVATDTRNGTTGTNTVLLNGLIW